MSLLHKPELSREETLEVDGTLGRDVLGDLVLERQADVHPVGVVDPGSAASRFHDPRSRPGDDAPTTLGHDRGELLGQGEVGIAFFDPSRAVDGHLRLLVPAKTRLE